MFEAQWEKERGAQIYCEIVNWTFVESIWLSDIYVLALRARLVPIAGKS